MSRRCDICGKGPTSGNNVSHSVRRTKRVFNANIQRIRVMENGHPVRKNVCTNCIKSGKVKRAL